MINMNSQFPYLILHSILVISLFCSFQRHVLALPLYTSSRWIVDEEGKRVKLACVNWPSHLETMVAEGLSKQPVDIISNKISSMGFNCVRFTWPLFLATNDSLGKLSVRQSFQSLGLSESIAGIEVNNPSFLELPVLQAFQVVVKCLADNSIMVILDNHISKPKYFDPNLWIKGLVRMATLFNDTSNVVAVSLRNELIGSKQNLNDWYKYMEKGAEAVHSVNPKVLVILSGLKNKEFGFLDKQPMNLTFEGKLMFEVHHGFSEGQSWLNGNANKVCGTVVVDNLMRRGLFLLEKGYPVLLSESGVHQRVTHVNDKRYLNCIMGIAVELDLNLALWTLTGDYYLREGVISLDETYGVLNWDWCGSRNSSFLQRISTLQTPLQGAGLSNSHLHKRIFHPENGLCILRKSMFKPLYLGSCAESEGWDYSPEKNLVIKGTYFCLKAVGLGKPAKLSGICSDNDSKWEAISDSKMHLSSHLLDGTTVCLDVDSSNNIITNECSCLSVDHTCDPGSQWFKIVGSTSSTNLSLAGESHTSFIKDPNEGKSCEVFFVL
ncbi:cellulase [Ranunculus cassubicifolius]